MRICYLTNSGIPSTSANSIATVKICEAFTEYQLEYNNVIATHDHISPFFGIPTTQSKQLLQSIFSTTFKFFNNTKMSIIKHLTNLSGFKSKYLRDSGKYFIQSDNNKTN